MVYFSKQSGCWRSIGGKCLKKRNVHQKTLLTSGAWQMPGFHAVLSPKKAPHHSMTTCPNLNLPSSLLKIITPLTFGKCNHCQKEYLIIQRWTDKPGSIREQSPLFVLSRSLAISLPQRNTVVRSLTFLSIHPQGPTSQLVSPVFFSFHQFLLSWASYKINKSTRKTFPMLLFPTL